MIKDQLLKTIGEKYPLKPMDAGEFSSLKASGMQFAIEAYEAEGLGHVSYMQAKGFFGLMKMDTLIINPKELDLPLLSYDRILAAGNDTFICELYDTCVRTFPSEKVDQVVTAAAALPERDPGIHWYDHLRMKQSLSKKGKKAQTPSFDFLIRDYLAAWLQTETEPLTDRETKEKKTSIYVECLLSNGGPSTDVFLKAFGREKTEKLFRKILFGTE